MTMWQDYVEGKSPEQHTVSGQLRLLPSLHSPQLNNDRSLLVYLPPSYHDQAHRRYPVIYMHDGQNLFDSALSFAGEWHVDETMQNLAGEGYEAIIVGIPNVGSNRLAEYSPFKDPKHGGGRGDDYLDFVVHTVKPLIDNDFRTLPDRVNTGVLGSSMGGLISLYAFFSRPEVFGFAGVLSPSVWFARGAIVDYIKQVKVPPLGKLYLDVGTSELSTKRTQWYQWKSPAKMYLNRVMELKQALERKGYRGDSLLYIEEHDGQHNEAAWARRLPDALRFLLPRVETLEPQL